MTTKRTIRKYIRWRNRRARFLALTDPKNPVTGSKLTADQWRFVIDCMTTPDEIHPWLEKNDAR